MLSCSATTTRQMRAPSNFLAKFGEFSHFPKTGGRGEESNRGILKLQIDNMIALAAEIDIINL